MHSVDIKFLADRLNGLAETFAKPQVTEKALAVWFDTLREFPTERVLDALNAWARTNSKFPAPADVWRVVNDRLIDERERARAAERAKERVQIEALGRSPEGAEIIAAMRGVVAKPERVSRQELAERMLASVHGDESKLLPMQREFVAANLGREAVVGREPGSDDEEISTQGDSAT